MLSVGTFVGALSGAYVADHIGRRGGIIVSLKGSLVLSVADQVCRLRELSLSQELLFRREFESV
jgi:hypothetical protein